MNLRIYSTVPSPYQRDLFLALAALPGVDPEVFYYEPSAPDSPWPSPKLESFETVLPGKCIGRGRVRSHWNFNLPRPAVDQPVVINAALTDVTTQRLMRRERNWWFWGELIRGGHGGQTARIRRWLARPLLRSRGIFAVGRVAASDYAHRFNGLRVINLPYHCQLDDFFAIERPRDQGRPSFGSELTLLFCGQMIERKGIDLLLAAFERCLSYGLNLRLLLTGREDRIAERLAALTPAARERIELIGFVSPTDLAGVFSRAQVMVLPSRHDGWGVVINQAMAAGLPVIATTAVQAAAELVEPGGGGWLVAPGDAVALQGAVADADHVFRNGKLSAMGDFNRLRARELTPETGARRLRDAIGL